MGPRTALRAMVARIRKNKDPVVQESLKKNVKIGDMLVKAELDSGAQVSIIGKGLVNSLGLKVRKLDQTWSLDGINPNEQKLQTDLCVDVSFVIFDTRVVVTCFVVSSESVQELLLLGLDFIFANMDVAVEWLKEAETAGRRLDGHTSATVDEFGEFVSRSTDACMVGSMSYGGDTVHKPNKKYSCEVKLLKEPDSGGINIASGCATPQEDLSVMLGDISYNYVGYNSGVGVEIADLDTEMRRLDSKQEARNHNDVKGVATLKKVKMATTDDTERGPAGRKCDALNYLHRHRKVNPFISRENVTRGNYPGADEEDLRKSEVMCEEIDVNNVLSIKRVSAAKMNKTLRDHEDINFSAVLLIRRINVNMGNDVTVGSCYESDLIKQEFSDVFCKELPKTIEYKGEIKHVIDVVADSKPTYSRAYRLSIDEREELEKQIEELISAGRIYPTTSPYGAPVLFVKKKDGSKRLCCDFRRLNAVTIKSRFPLPLIEDLFDHLHGAKWFTSLDLISGYHQIPVAEKDQPKTAIVTHQGQYAWRVMPFGLTNAPSTFQMVMNDLFRDILNKKVLVYLDDILVYSSSKEQHLQDVREVLKLLRSIKLYAKESKCALFQQSIFWLGHYIDKEGIHMDPRKVEAITKWPTPTTPKEARSFLGLCGYFRRFVKKFSHIARPLYEYIAGKQEWNIQQTAAFQMLKEALMKGPILCPFSDKYKVRVTTDASKFAVGAVLELIDGENKTKGVVAYLSKVLVHYQLNWPIRDKEFYAIVHALKTWRHYLVGRNFDLYTDHKSLETIMKSTELNSRLQRWISQLADYDFNIKYIPGENNKADGLSRISIKKICISTGNMEGFMVKKIRKSYKNNLFLNQVIEILKGEEECPVELRTIVKRYRLENGLLYYGVIDGFQDRLVIPTKDLQYEILRTYHSSKAAGHPGISRTYANIAPFYYWKKMKNMITKFVKSCESCQKAKNSHLLPIGVYHPLEIPTRRFEAINIDFVSGMTLDEGYDQIMVITDRLTKWAIFKAMNKKVSTQEIASVLLKEVVLQYGIPRFIVSDRDPKFVNSIWEEFARRLEITTGFSTSYNPQSDGQVERLNKTMIESIRTYVRNKPKWVEYLPLAAFAYNTTYQVSLGASPFVALRGYKERFGGLYNPKWDKPKYVIPKGDLVRQNAHKAMISYLHNMEAMLLMFRDSLAEAQDQQSLNYNKRHRGLELFKPGDKVLIHKDAYVRNGAGRKFHYMWFGPFEVVKMLGDQNVEIKRGELSSKRHNVFNVRSVKHYVSTDTQFHQVPKATLEELRKQAQRIVRIVDITKDEQNREILLVMLDGCTEVDPVQVSAEELKKILPKRELLRLYEKFKRNRPWFRNNVELVS